MDLGDFMGLIVLNYKWQLNTIHMQYSDQNWLDNHLLFL